MNPIKNMLQLIQSKTGLSERIILWSSLSLLFMGLFSALFTYPITQKIRSLDEENARLQARMEEQILLATFDIKLREMMKNAYPDLDKLNVDGFEEERLLELPSLFEALAAESGVTLVAIHPQSVEDGQQVAIDLIFQGEIEKLYALMKIIGRVPYARQLDALNILALSNAEQMQLKFKVPIK
jgi:hypothetical protein